MLRILSCFFIMPPAFQYANANGMRCFARSHLRSPDHCTLSLSASEHLLQARQHCPAVSPRKIARYGQFPAACRTPPAHTAVKKRPLRPFFDSVKIILHQFYIIRNKKYVEKPFLHGFRPESFHIIHISQPVFPLYAVELPAPRYIKHP